jgi:hypothetical protein
VSAVTRQFYSQLVRDFLRRLQEQDAELMIELAADIGYLVERGRAAQLPQVRFGVSQSEFRNRMGEIRTHRAGSPTFVRTLFVLEDDGTLVLLVAGDKGPGSDRPGNTWYDYAVPLADEAYRAWRTEQGKPPIE